MPPWSKRPRLRARQGNLGRRSSRFWRKAMLSFRGGSTRQWRPASGVMRCLAARSRLGRWRRPARSCSARCASNPRRRRWAQRTLRNSRRGWRRSAACERPRWRPPCGARPPPARRRWSGRPLREERSRRTSPLAWRRMGGSCCCWTTGAPSWQAARRQQPCSSQTCGGGSRRSGRSVRMPCRRRLRQGRAHMRRLLLKWNKCKKSLLQLKKHHCRA
mmetsp:Transcript_148273/g.412950  ORF Transcript_148273/g.412950 Transcript_148273/m.412950 type:complete len:217 (-) Transcript_148273:2407-3057(-)